MPQNNCDAEPTLECFDVTRGMMPQHHLFSSEFSTISKNSLSLKASTNPCKAKISTHIDTHITPGNVHDSQPYITRLERQLSRLKLPLAASKYNTY